MIDMAKMRKELIDDEGLQRKAYRDSLGYLTIGVGRLIDPRRPGGLTVAEIVQLLENDIQAALADVETLPCWQGLKTDEQRRALVNMRFQLGFQGLKSFGTFLDLMAKGEYKKAGEDLRGTKWFQEAPARAGRIIKMIDG